jgi:Cu2+-exporting ATPase
MSSLAPPLNPPPDLAVLDDPVEQQRFTRYTDGADGERVADSALRITGMHCAACAGLIEQAALGVEGVLAIEVSAAGERARVRWATGRTRLGHIVAAIRAAGYDALPDAAVTAREARKAEGRKALWRLFVAGFCAMQVMMLATPGYFASGGSLAPDLRELLNWGSWVLTLPVMVFSAGPFFAGAWRSLRQRRIGMDVPVALGIAVTFVASSGATFDPGGLFGREVYFDSLTMFVAFLLAGRWLETRARHRVAQVLEATLAGMPATAWRIEPDGHAVEVSAQRLVAGDRVRVAVGQAFAADGELIEGQTSADEALLTGESAPVAKRSGDAVVAGSINLGAPVVMRVQRVGADTRIEGIVALMRDAMSQRPALARTADRWAAPFLWAVLLLAAASAAFWSLVDPSRAVWVAVAVLIVTCPCALSLAAPSALLAAASALARRGVMLQRLDALEALTQVRRLYLDKTGTVTDERLQLRALQRLPAAEADDATLRALAASLAAWSTHPLARALAAAAPAGDPAAWHAIEEVSGRGLQARDPAGRCWRLGSRDFVDPAATPPDDDAAAQVWFGREGIAWARFELDEALRSDAADAVAALRARGVEPVLLSGDRQARAQRMARQLGIARVIGEATPETKLAEVAQAQAAGLRVAMVGDGLNDAPVLARADVSLAMGQGAIVARTQADAVLVSGALSGIVAALDTARRTMKVVRQNIVWAVVYNAACVPLAVVGWLPPWAAGLGMAGSSLLVVGNALRLAR